jgi:hypothetical protein
MPTPADEMRSHLDAYLTGQCSLEQFEEWFSPVLRDVHKLHDAEAEGLANAIEWAFCDLERGVPSDKVKDTLSRFVSEKAPPLVRQALVVGGAVYTAVADSGTSSKSNLQSGAGFAVSLGPLQITPETARV